MICLDIFHVFLFIHLDHFDKNVFPLFWLHSFWLFRSYILYICINIYFLRSNDWQDIYIYIHLAIFLCHYRWFVKWLVKKIFQCCLRKQPWLRRKRDDDDNEEAAELFFSFLFLFIRFVYIRLMKHRLFTHVCVSGSLI